MILSGLYRILFKHLRKFLSIIFRNAQYIHRLFRRPLHFSIRFLMLFNSVEILSFRAASSFICCIAKDTSIASSHYCTQQDMNQTYMSIPLKKDSCFHFNLCSLYDITYTFLSVIPSYHFSTIASRYRIACSFIRAQHPFPAAMPCYSFFQQSIPQAS